MPAPPARLTARAEAWKSAPRPPTRLVRAKVPQGERNNSSTITTSRRRRSERTSRLNCRKLSPARRLSAPGAGIKRKMVAGRKTIAPIRIAAGTTGRRRTNSPPAATIRPVPLNNAMLIHLLSAFFCSFGVMLDNQPPRAELERIAAALPMMRAI